MTRLLLTISSGTGPLEVRSFVRLLSATIADAVAHDQATLEHTVVHGPHQAPASVDLIFEAARWAMERWVGISVRIESERSQHRNRARALELLEQALQREHQLRVADARSARRLRSLHVERGRPVMVWRVSGDGLVREEVQDAT